MHASWLSTLLFLSSSRPQHQCSSIIIGVHSPLYTLSILTEQLCVRFSELCKRRLCARLVPCFAGLQRLLHYRDQALPPPLLPAECDSCSVLGCKHCSAVTATTERRVTYFAVPTPRLHPWQQEAVGPAFTHCFLRSASCRCHSNSCRFRSAASAAALRC